MVRDKVRIRFRKGGDLRLVSHHDLMRCFERMLRRSCLPFHSTQGFNPKPRLVFALSLSLGIIGCQEVVELELDEETSPEEVHERLARQAPAGLDILSVRRIPPRITGQVRSISYRVEVGGWRVAGEKEANEGWRVAGKDHPLSTPHPASPSTLHPPTSTLEERVQAILDASEVWVDRTHPRSKRVNLRPFIRHLRILPSAVAMDLWATPQGTARAEEILTLLGLDDWPGQGAVIERTTLELLDESQPSQWPAPGSPTEEVA